MARRLRCLGGDGGLAVSDDAIADLVNVEAKPLKGARAGTIISRTVAMDATGLE